ncbi:MULTISPECIES: hypothetical protein [unclassified Streptomyces]|uniref:hypothetical protein n=1 Tax=unclassified Streptomyces TaxID=2593676 RepID=UPI001367D8B9|nr:MULTISPECIES: hypothetical protein [unclassified Streptomyces]NDZ98500.1 hypothetical protein [Streptomyces sp. SID10116]MYY79773.1 hypothetical protein [Streptomyces sp. SID335]MYZ16523.1 hypothetical protein [Streptomyces sp. SID337]NDZ84490.1 hypothetical protein [Streptomyces sp. SID10115]NEB43453.1 hypothetical protein [Streptomyces sp. SID339]
MARYTIKYLDGCTDTITAHSVVKQAEEDQYYFGNATGQPVALIPSNGVRAIIREGVETVID